MPTPEQQKGEAFATRSDHLDRLANTMLELAEELAKDEGGCIPEEEGDH